MSNSGIILGAGKGDPGPNLVADLNANRPAAGSANRLFIPTDYGLPAIDNGSSWNPTVEGFRCTAPVVANYTNINFGSYVSLTQDGDGAMFLNSGDGNGANYAAASVVAIPGSGAYSLTVGFDIMAFHPTQNAGFLGLCITDGAGSTPKMDLFYLLSMNNSYALGAYTQNWSNPTTWGATITTVTMPPFIMRGRLFMRLMDDRNANLTWGIGMDGRNFDSLIATITMARATYLTPSHIGVMTGHGAASVATGTTRMRARIFHWLLSQP